MVTEWLKNLARLYLPVYKFESNGAKVAYAGYSSVKKRYYIRLILGGSDNQVYLGRRWFWQIPGLVKTNRFDMAISEISPIALRYFQNYEGYIIPEWSATIINIDRPLSEICHRNVSDFPNVLRRIRKYSLTYEIQTEKESFEFFKERFHAPYISKRYGDEAWIDDLDRFWNSSPRPFVMLIKEQGTTVGAALIKRSPESLHLLRVGLLDGNEEYRLHGVIGAIYYFAITEGQKSGCRHLNLGGTRPFLSDGLTKYKMGLGAEFVSDLNSHMEYLWLGADEHSPAAERILHDNPFMYVDKEFILTKHES